MHQKVVVWKQEDEYSHCGRKWHLQCPCDHFCEVCASQPEANALAWMHALTQHPADQSRPIL